MQPMVSPVDHESRHNSYRAQDEEQGVTERTPLINRFPESSVPRRSIFTSVVVGVLLLTLIVGLVIGIRLLVLQDDEENVLPPVESALKVVTRAQWDKGGAPVLGAPEHAADYLVAVQTDTKPCADGDSCAALLREIKGSSGLDLPHNFLLSSNGRAYEARGWQACSMFQQNSSLVLAFIGNFTESPPSREKMNAGRQFFGFAESQQRLKPTFTIIGKNTKYSPKYLYRSLKTYPQWNRVLSDG